MREALIGSPSSAFAVGISASQVEATYAAPGRSQAARPPSEPAATVAPALLTMPARPATAVDGPYRVPVSRPATLRADLVAVSCRVEAQAGGTSLTGMSRVSPFHGDACPLCLVGDEGGKLLE